MKMQDLEKKTVEELQNMLAERRSELYAMRLQTGVNRLRDVSTMTKKRKEMARIEMQISKLMRESQ